MNVNLSLLFSFFLPLHKANAFNITQVLSQYPDFSNFNSYLTETNLAGEINSRQTITVLPVDNSNLSPLSGKSSDVLKNILSLHVILDYFDVQKLQKLTNRSTIVTTLFQTTGLARGQQGFLNVTHLSMDSVVFGSAVPGSTLGSSLVKSIASQPYNLSGIDGTTNSTSNNSPSASPSVPPTSSMSPDMPPYMSPPTPAPMAPPTLSQAPAPSDAPSNAETSAEDVTPAATPGSPPIPIAPTADAPAADAPADDSPGAGTALQSGLNFVVTVILSTLFLASRTWHK
ncbi:hypothetical protein Pfo_011836 [Paulownia fortunei]|nr:hypothetical protein Pfo_011836 [Paulownia fortunei]